MGTDRARRVGDTVPAAEHYPGHASPALTTHSTPLQGVPGPAPLSGLVLARSVGGWVVPRYSPSPYPPGIPTRHAPRTRSAVLHRGSPRALGHRGHAHMTLLGPS